MADILKQVTIVLVFYVQFENVPRNHFPFPGNYTRILNRWRGIVNKFRLFPFFSVTLPPESRGHLFRFQDRPIRREEEKKKKYGKSMF